MISLLKLTENDKRILVIVFLAIIIIFLFIGLIVSIIKRIMKAQGKAVDTYMYDVVKAKLVTKPLQFRAVAKKKNFILFYKHIKIPMILLSITAIILLQYIIIKGTFNISFIFSVDKGFGSLLYKWDWKSVERSKIFGIKTFIPAEWPKLSHTPTFLNTYEGWTSYLSVPCLVVGLILYFIHLVGFISRDIQARKLSKKVFEKTLVNPSINN